MWIAGAMMWYGVSPASWIRYSPRSVSVASTPAAASRLLRSISSESIDLPLITRLTPSLSTKSRMYPLAASPSRAKKTLPPDSVTLASTCSR